jgi:mannitol/fructose-specific phosphotransferase system IIA component
MFIPHAITKERRQIINASIYLFVMRNMIWQSNKVGRNHKAALELGDSISIMSFIKYFH